MKNTISLSLLVLFLFLPALSIAQQDAAKSMEELISAFDKDGYDVVRTASFQGQRGIMALHRTAINYESKQRKKAFYLEGNAYQMGYLMGLLAQEDVERMSSEFVDKVLFDFIHVDIDPNQIPIIWGILKNMLWETTQKVIPDAPASCLEEIQGLVDGCKHVNPNSKVVKEHLLMLNFGFDGLLSNLYALNKVNRYGLSPKDIQIPVMCNAFSVFGNATVGNKHYFGRDFMFPTAGVYEYTAALVIYRATDGRIPLVSMSGPGFVGSIATMNIEGVGMGVDMLPSNNCNPDRPGLNSLALVRHASGKAYSAQHALDAVVEAQRGVSWLYFIADGKNDKAAVAETGMKTDNLDCLSYPPEELKALWMLPGKEFLYLFENQQHQKGIFVRWNDYSYPQEFLQFNRDLFYYHGKKELEGVWGPLGYVNLKKEDGNCPAAFYFAPQRENKDDVLLVTNHALVPSMRLCGMHPWTALIADAKYDDIQWRYDELNAQILESYGKIDQAKAMELIDYLAPYRKFPNYYDDSKKSSDGKTRIIRGSISLCNLTEKVMHSYFGFYTDQWISITLPNYVE